jgi:hypothetical protein
MLQLVSRLWPAFSDAQSNFSRLRCTTRDVYEAAKTLPTEILPMLGRRCGETCSPGQAKACPTKTACLALEQNGQSREAG